MSEEERVGLLEIRAALAEHRLENAQRLGEINRKLDLLLDELAAFRAECNSHTHE